MIVLFSGGGPAQGIMRNFSTDLSEIRVATQKMLSDGKAAWYVIGDRETLNVGQATAVAEYVGVKDSAASLVDWVTE